MAILQNVIASVNFNFNSQQTQTTGNLNAGGSTLLEIVSMAKQYVNNNGVNYGVDQLYAVQLSLAAAATTLHFQTSTAKDPFGNTLAMLRIRDVIVQNTNTTLSQFLKVYVPASNAITFLPPVASYIPVQPGGMLWLSDPLSFGGGVGQVCGATTDGLTVDPAAFTIVANVLVIGNGTA